MSKKDSWADDRTTIECRTSTRNRLRAWKGKHGYSYDEALHELMDAYGVEQHNVDNE